MDAKTHITPGVIEQYCLGLLPPEESQEVERQAALRPEIKEDIDRFMERLEQRLLSEALEPPEEVKAETLSLLHNLKIEHDGNLNELPVLNKYSDHHNWLRLVKPLLPEKLDRSMFIREIRNDDRISQMVIWSAVDYPDEVHADVRESFIILRGRCRCFIGTEAVELGPGGFLEIPLHKHHDVKVLEPPVLAVVQRVKVA